MVITAMADSVRKDLEEGAPATTLLVCPHVKAWDSFEAFQEFYQAKLMNGYLYAEKDRCSTVISTIYINYIWWY